MTVTRPKTLDEALALLKSDGVTTIAGGTDVIVQGRLQTKCLSELTQVTEDPDSHEVSIGAAVTFNRITDHPLLRERYPLLVQACHTVGSHQIRNRATIGGNIVNAAPCGDSIPPSILYDASVELRSHAATRRMSLAEFLLSGYKTQRQPDELLTRVILPPPAHPKAKGFYHQLGRRNALNITRQSLTALLEFAADGTVSYCRLVDGALFSKRWSAAYKQPVFVSMFRDMMAQASTQ